MKKRDRMVDLSLLLRDLGFEGYQVVDRAESVSVGPNDGAWVEFHGHRDEATVKIRATAEISMRLWKKPRKRRKK